MVTTTSLLTVDDLWRMPGDEPWELWDGELRKVPSAGIEASDIAANIVHFLKAFVKPRDLGVVTGSDGTYILWHNPDMVVVSDAAFVRWDRLPGRIRPRGYSSVPPDLAVEVRSPTDERGDIEKKLDCYRRAGVPLVWWCDPVRRTVAVYLHGLLVAELGVGEELDGGDVLTGFRLPVADVFA